MSEDDLLTAVLDLCKVLHLHTAHFRPAKTDRGWRTAVSGDGKGFPDLVVVGDNGVLFRELKANGGRISPEQRAWLDRLAFARANVAVWHPSDLRSGRILDELKAVT